MAKARRGRNEGMVRYIEKKKLYEARYPVGIGTDGKTIYKSIYGKKKTGTGGVLERMRDALAALGKGEYVDPSGKTLYLWCKEWYETYKEHTVRVNTQDKYVTSLKRIEPSDIANMRLKDLTQELIQKYYNKLKSNYSNETIKATHSLINGALEKAEEIKMINRNPARYVTIPKTDEDDESDDVRALTNSEYELFMDEMLKRSAYFMFAHFMSNTGLRPGEAIALNREDIDLKNNAVRVKKTFIRKTKSTQNNTKTKSSKRMVPIPDITIKLLKEYMLRQKNSQGEAPLFQTKVGTRIGSRNALRAFKEIGSTVKLHGGSCLDWVNLHTMRHTYASRLFKEGKDVKVISSLLGHSKVSTTYDIYVHFIDSMIEDSVQVLSSDVFMPDTLPEKTKRISKQKKANVAQLKKVSTT